MQRPKLRAAGAKAVRLSSSFPDAVRLQGNEGVQMRPCGAAVEQGVGIRFSRDLAASQGGDGFGGGELDQ